MLDGIPRYRRTASYEGCLYLGYITCGEGKRYRSRQRTTFDGSWQHTGTEIKGKCEDSPEVPLKEFIGCNLEG